MLEKGVKRAEGDEGLSGLFAFYFDFSFFFFS